MDIWHVNSSVEVQQLAAAQGMKDNSKLTVDCERKAVFGGFQHATGVDVGHAGPANGGQYREILSHRGTPLTMIARAIRYLVRRATRCQSLTRPPNDVQSDAHTPQDLFNVELFNDAKDHQPTARSPPVV